MSYLGQEIKQILPGNVAVGGANMGMVPLFAVLWCPSRSSIWAGYVAADGQELSKALYPDADAGIQAGNVPAAIEATWQSTPTERGKYVATSSAGKFRLPDLNGVSVGTLGAVFLRGDGVNSSGTDGVIQLDAMQGHYHNVRLGTGTGTGIASGGSTGGTNVNDGTVVPTGGTVLQATSDGVNGTPRVDDETRPLNVTGCWVIKLFGSVTNAGSADAAQLATDYAALAANKVDIASFLGSNQLVGANGYQKLPGGVIMQWGTVANASTASVLGFVYPLAFPNAVTSVVLTALSTNPAAGYTASGPAPTGVNIYKNASATNYSLNYLIFGY